MNEPDDRQQTATQAALPAGTPAPDFTLPSTPVAIWSALTCQRFGPWRLDATSTSI